MKFNRIAVCLRGHIRNWNYTKDKFFYFYKEIANEVHYYYATWDLPYIESTDLNFTFNNNQVGVLVSPKTDHYVYGSRVGPAYLSSHIRLVDTYDAVVDTRFDMIPVLLDGQLISIDDMTIETSYMLIFYGDTIN